MQVNIKGEVVKLPDFLIVGAAKSGTTSLYNYLRQHPQVFLPENKEPWFFSFPELTRKDDEIFSRDLNIVTDFNDYLDLFKDALNSQVLGEASTCYLYLYRETIENIKMYHPAWEKLKIVVIIRNPIERAYSHYLTDVAGGALSLSFEELLEKWKRKQLTKCYNYIDYGFYYEQIKAYKNNFENVKIYLYEELEKDSLSLVKDILSFLGVGDSFKLDASVKYNVSIDSKNKLIGSLIYKQSFLKQFIKILMPEKSRIKLRNNILNWFTNKPQMKLSSRNFLQNIYREDILNLQDLVNEDCREWLK